MAMRFEPTTRRRALEIGGSGLAGVAAGCLQSPEETDDSAETPAYTAAREGSVYLGPDITEEVPAFVTVVEDARAADVALVAADTTVPGATVVQWLREGVPSGVYGEPAVTTLLERLRAGDAGDHFEGEFLSSGRGHHDIAVFYPDGEELHSYTGRIDGRDPSLVEVLDRVLDYVFEQSERERDRRRVDRTV
ncbi:hypothetical protein ACOZ4N_12920 [Halorientalis pallida]|uniref:hypothetical protein n=1 Tax=Halorientalis pallida TaxID=2479928 RepID=UPI003C6F161B